MTDKEKVKRLMAALVDLIDSVSMLNNTSRRSPDAMILAYKRSFASVDSATKLMEEIKSNTEVL
jgi:hypothetical protein